VGNFLSRFDKRGAFIKAVEPGKNFQIYERLFLSLEYVICITTHATFESTSSQGLLEFNWTEGYSKLSIIRPGCSRLLEFENKIVLVV
jgi:hypothetical protein